MTRAWALGFIFAVGCAQPTLPPPISIVGLHDLTRSNDLLFMTSTDENELRVLDLNPNNPLPRDFIRAPNPIEPLSVPVLGRPIALAHDVSWDDNGLEDAGTYVYAQGAADSEVSVVSAARQDLFEACRLQVTGTVTAIAARAADAWEPSGSTLYFATTDGQQATLSTVTLPPPAGLPRAFSGDHYICAQSADGGSALVVGGLLTLPAESIDSLLVVPRPPDSPQIAVATHAPNGGGRTFLLDPATLRTTPLPFPAPVRMLATHEAVKDPISGNPVLGPGKRIFGVLDESSCGDRAACNGVVAVDVDATTATVASDVGGYPMLNLGVGDALVTGLSLARAAQVAVPSISANAPTPVSFGLLGIVSASNGPVYFFDALGLEFVNAGGAPAAVVADAVGNAVVNYNTADGGVLLLVPNTGLDPGSIAPGAGAANSQTVTVTFQGVLPGLQNLVGTFDGGVFTAPTGVSWPTLVQVGDLVQLGGLPDGTLCPAQEELPVVSVSATTVTVDGGIPADCAAWSTFTLRAGGAPAEPFVVVGSTDGFMGRLSSGPPTPPACTPQTPPDPHNGCFQFAGTYYFHPANPTPGQPAPPLPPALTFRLLTQDPAIQQDSVYSFTVASNYSPLFFTVDPRVGNGFQLPGAVDYDVALQRAYVSYPAANGVMEVPLSSLIPNSANYLYLQPYR